MLIIGCRFHTRYQIAMANDESGELPEGERATLLVDTGAVPTTFSQEKIPTQRAASKIRIDMARGSVVARRQEVRFSSGESAF